MLNAGGKKDNIKGEYKKTPEWLETKWLLSLFGKSKKRYRQFVENVQYDKIQDSSKDMVNGLILGGIEFVDWIKISFLDKMANSNEKPQLINLKPGLKADVIIPFVCDEFGCERETIIQKGLKNNIARDVAFF